MAAAPEFSSGSVADRLDTSRRKIELFLQLADPAPLVAQELRRMAKTVAYLRANFPPAALARGPVRAGWGSKQGRR